MAAKAQEAESAGQKLVYVGAVDVASGKCTAGLKVSHRYESEFSELPHYELIREHSMNWHGLPSMLHVAAPVVKRCGNCRRMRRNILLRS